MSDHDDYRVTLMTDGQPIEFLFDGGPIGDPQPAEVAFLALGLITASWARLEQHLDAVIIQINKTHHSNEQLRLYDPAHPRPFNDKIRLTKRYFSNHPALQKHKEVIGELIKMLSQLASERNVFLHSNLEKYDPESGTVSFRNLQMSKNDDLTVTRHEVPLKALQSFPAWVAEANGKLCTISAELFTSAALEQLRRP